MKNVYKKSQDSAVNQVLAAAYRSRTPLIWDRAEAMQPQCGFGRLAICCTDCQEGPCRTNPFSAEQQQTICGRDKQELAARSFLRKASDGALALTKLAAQYEPGCSFYDEAVSQLAVSDDEMLAFADTTERLATIGRCTNTVLEQISQSRQAAGSGVPAAVGINLGVLRADAVNIVFHGHVDWQYVLGVQAAARDAAIPVQFSSLCGNELNGNLPLPLLTNYDSQEVPLLTGLVDLIVIGGQCVLPSLVKLAASRKIPVVKAAAKTVDYAAVIQSAWQAYKNRSSIAAAVPAVSNEAYIGFTIDNSAELFQRVTEQFRQGSLQGVVYLGGCGSVANTQDAQPVQLAAALVEAGYLVITGGCAGTALAKAGLCQADGKNEVPPVLHIGSCHDAGEFLRIAAYLQQNNVPVKALFPEINHNKVLATALGFAAAGIPSWLGFEAVPDEVYEKAELLPLPEAAELLQTLRKGAGK
ncbi:prismane/CO dehydrogenase family protein [Anaerospora hongkongensis]|uniref:Prismane/CO dehydrogenase family protein n=1 Tax=Anaerospora hongkongensis TaxID=244830 RepID=A0A4R1Q6U2_9FIRM|nr:hypothetical protein [Anaerospora hongkongensis]TCL37697.1 prismane/CO dehydrogenase family protein [Anaerospora hongkongensis]